jgi:hypothetical protein
MTKSILTSSQAKRPEEQITGEKKPALKSRFFECGRRERIRTSDPLVPNQLRYQAALLADAGRILLLTIIRVNHFLAPANQVVIKAA